MGSHEDIIKIVNNCYLDILDRVPDEAGLNHYVELLESNQIDESELRKIFMDSLEYKLSHPTDLDPNFISVEKRMKTDWDARAKQDVKFVIRSISGQTEDEFWKSGFEECDSILGINTPRFDWITQNRNPKTLSVLEIGCGIGRILFPMTQIFGTVYGVDVSPEMVTLGKKYAKKFPSCQIVENNGTDLSMFEENIFDFCYSYIVFQHIPDKKIVINNIKEVSRVLKSNGIFRFQVRGNIDTKPKKITTWDGVRFTSNEIHSIASDFKFKILEETGENQEYYWLTFQSMK